MLHGPAGADNLVAQTRLPGLRKEWSEQLCPTRSLRVWLYFVETILFAFNGEVESPPAVHADLPEIESLVVLLSPQRRMVEIFEEEPTLLVEGFLHFWRCRGVLRR